MAADFLVLVEGKNDHHVVRNLLEANNFEPLPTVESREGIDQLLKSLRAQLVSSELRFLGIVVDADTDAAARWQSVRDTLRRAGSEAVPEEVDEAGTVLTHQERLRIGIWIMPDNQMPGRLEYFVISLIAPDDPLLMRARTCVEQIPPQQRRFSHTANAILKTWLAWQEQPGLPMVSAVRVRYVRHDCEPARTFLEWLRFLRWPERP